MLAKGVLSIQELNWSQLTSSTAKQVISRHRRNDNGSEMYKSEKCACEAFKTAYVFFSLLNMQIYDVLVAVFNEANS